MARVKRKQADGSWLEVGVSPLVTPLEIVRYDGIAPPETIEPGDVVVLFNPDTYAANSSSLTNTGISLTIPKAGTYRLKWWVDSTLETTYSRLYQNGVAVGNQVTSNNVVSTYTLDLVCSAGDVITLYYQGAYDSWEGDYYGACGNLCACINWPALEGVA